MDKYEQFEESVKHITIDEVDKMPCPNCGGAISFHGSPDETYMMDGTYIRNELLWCHGCDLNIEVEQVYAPVKCYVTEFNDAFCEKEEA